MHRLARSILLGAVLFVAASIAAFGQAPSLSPQLDADSVVSLRLMFGLDRFTPQRWDGGITVGAGRVVRMSGVHFEGRDEVVGRDRWRLTNRVTRYADSTTQRGYDPVHTRQYAMIPNGVAATLEAAETSPIEVATEQGSFSFALQDVDFGRERKFLDGLASVQRIPTTLDLTAGDSDNDYPALAADAGGIWVSWISYRDERDAVWLARHDGERWLEPVRVSPEPYADNFRTAVAIDRNGAAVVVWSGKSPDGAWGLYSRSFSSGALSEVSSLADAGPNLYHQAVSDSAGNVHVAWQSFRRSVARILHTRWDGSAWSGESNVSEAADSDNWAPAVAADSKGNVWVGWDGYADGDFNVYVRRRRADGRWDAVRQITRSAGFDANVSLACDSDDRLWMAWDHGEANWGKDWSSQRFRPGGGAGLYRVRSVKVAALDSNRLRQAPDLMDAVPAGARDYVQQARLATDAKGHVWAMVRSLTSVTSRVNNNWGAGGIWEMLLTRLDGDGWLPATKLHGTNGRNDTWAAAVVDRQGKLWFAWSRDARRFGSPTRPGNRGSPQARDTHVSYAVVDPAQAAWRGDGEPVLRDFREPSMSALPVHPTEAADTAAIRAYRYETNGETYRILRGDLHRHTDISADGIGEGGLIDFYRYALTAGNYDFMMVADHQFGGDSVPGVEYNWWRTEKSEDIFLVPGRFWPLFGTERSLPYPNGHRNTVFARRGVRSGDASGS